MSCAHPASLPWFAPWSEPSPYSVEFPGETRLRPREGNPRFTLRVKSPAQFTWIRDADPYSVALAYVRGEYEIDGDAVSAIAWKAAHTRHDPRYRMLSAAARLAALFSPPSDADKIRFHYDRSNEFYRQFLDERMVYSCAYFADPAWTLERAQEAKLELICRKLDLRAGERFLDIGCGWGALLLHATERYGVAATGCTLSREQGRYAERLAGTRAMVYEADFRRLGGRFDKIASVGMFEHVGRRRLPAYFRTIERLLEDDGLFVNHGIVRPEPEGDTPETLFLQRRVFPGGELPHLSEVIRAAGAAGFEVRDIESLRPHYALTCREWVRRLEANRAACRRYAGEETWRTWRLYLAASAHSFSSGHSDVCQIVLAKRGTPPRRLTRDYLYARPG